MGHIDDHGMKDVSYLQNIFIDSMCFWLVCRLLKTIGDGMWCNIMIVYTFALIQNL